MDPVSTVLTRREGTKNWLVRTPEGSSDVMLITLPPWKMVLIRVARVYLQSVLGFLIATSSGAVTELGVSLPPKDFYGLLLTCSILGLAPATISLIQNTIEIFTQLDTSNPSLRA
jgi:hypothetical protein